MSENLFVMPSGKVLPRCAYCLDRPVLYRLKDYKISTGDVFDAYFCKDCDGVGQAINHYASRINVRLRITVDPIMEERMVYHNWAAKQTEEALHRAKPDRYLRYSELMAWFNDYETSGAWKKDLQRKILERGGSSND
jgi:hypothetical protein